MSRYCYARRTVCTLVAIASLAASARARDAASLADELSELELQVAKVTEEEIAGAQAQLAVSLSALERRLIPGSKNASDWKDFIVWQTLADFASGEGDPELTDLQTSLDRLTSGDDGLELAEFQQVARDARRLFDRLLLARVPDPQRFVEAQLQQVAGVLREDATLLDARASYAMEQRLDLFAGIDGAQAFIESVTRSFGQPNFYTTTSQALLNRVAQRPVSQRSPVAESILGTRVTGTGDTTGQVTVSTVPSAGAARLALRFNGGIQSSTLGVNGPACIRSTAATSFAGEKQVLLSREVFSTWPASFSARTRSTTRSISKRGGGFGERIVVAVARRKVAEQKPCADAIAADRAEARLAAEFNQQVEQGLSEARRDFEQEVLAPLVRRHAPPDLLDFGTTASQLTVVMRQAARGQLAAPGPPPPGPAGDAGLRVHQSGANNFAAAVLGGAVLSQDAANKQAKLSVPAPDWVDRLLSQRTASPSPTAEQQRAFKPWRLTFRRSRPVSFQFTQGEIVLLIHAAELRTDEDRFTGWDFILRLKPIMQDGHFKLVREGDIEVFPTGFNPAGGGRLSSRQLALRNNIKPLVNRDPRREFPLRDVTLRNGRGTLTTRSVASGGGWLTLAWDLL